MIHKNNYQRKSSKVYAKQLRTYYLNLTKSGILFGKPGDWLIVSGNRKWVVEQDKFYDLYEPNNA